MDASSVSLILSVIVCLFRIGTEAVDTSRKAYRVIPNEKECYGTNMGFSISGSSEFHYESLRRRYSGCTYVQGNLEVTNLDSANMTYDLSFLSKIRVVTGYVLLGLLNVETIPLTHLRLIRADNIMSLMAGNYSLIVALTSENTESGSSRGLKELQLPSLREISQGRVLFRQNPLLCHVDTIAWDVIVHDSEDPVEIQEGGTAELCEPCPNTCADDTGVPRCWGHRASMCQKVKRVECDSLCPGRCHEKGIMGCCHPECAVGCNGGLDVNCEMCKYFRHGHRCVPLCPKNTHPLGQECVRF